jgi:hypothetical protein
LGENEKIHIIMSHFIFIDESGDPGKPFIKVNTGERVPTGASLFYILSAVCVDSQKLFQLETRMMEIKNRYKYRSELKSTNIPLTLYGDLLELVNELEIPVFYRVVDKEKYKGKFAVDGDKKLHNVFDEYNLTKLSDFAVRKCGYDKSEIIIDRAERRLLDSKFDNFNDYLKSKVNTKTIERVRYVTHVDSEYVNAMQLSDLISGALKDYFTGKNKDLKNIIKKKYLYKIY